MVPTKQKSSRIALRRQAKDGNRAIARLEQAGKISSFGKMLQNSDSGKLSGKRSRQQNRIRKDEGQIQMLILEFKKNPDWTKE